jgi:hypothetical protein
LFGSEAGPSAKVGEVAFRGAWTDANACRRVGHGSADLDKSRKNVDLARRPSCRSLAAQMRFAHAGRLAAASHSSRPSIGMV